MEPPSEFRSLNLTLKQLLALANPWKRLVFVTEIPMINELKLTHFTQASQPSMMNFGTYRLRVDNV